MDGAEEDSDRFILKLLALNMPQKFHDQIELFFESDTEQNVDCIVFGLINFALIPSCSKVIFGNKDFGILIASSNENRIGCS